MGLIRQSAQHLSEEEGTTGVRGGVPLGDRADEIAASDVRVCRLLFTRTDIFVRKYNANLRINMDIKWSLHFRHTWNIAGRSSSSSSSKTLSVAAAQQENTTGLIWT